MLPEGLVIKRVTGDGWTITQSGQLVTATYPALKPGNATPKLSIEVEITCHKNECITNVAYVGDPFFCSFPNSFELALVELLDTLLFCPLTSEFAVDPIQCYLNCVNAGFVTPFFFGEVCTSQALADFKQRVCDYAQALVWNDPTGTIIQIQFNEIVFALSEDQRALIGDIKVPTLFAVGTVDSAVPFQNSVYMQQRVEGSVLVEFAGKGHLLLLTDTGNFDRILLDFVEGKRLPQSSIVGNPCSCDVCPTAFLNHRFQ